MKKLLFIIPLLFIALASQAQMQCGASFSPSAAPQNNNLLRWKFSNGSISYGAVGTPAAYTTFYMNFGDGTGANITYAATYHVYSAPGSYVVGLRVSRYDSATNALICTDTVHSTVYVYYSNAATSWTATPLGAGQYTFTATTPASTGTMIYNWAFGDGTTGTGSPITHTYAGTGIDTVTLSAHDLAYSYTNTQVLSVQGSGGAGGFSSCGNGLAPGFSTAIGLGYDSNTAYIYNSATTPPGYTSVITYDYGDGSTGTSANYWHSYAATGTYTIKQKVQWMANSTGGLYCQDSISHSVTIVAVPSHIVGILYHDSLSVPPGSNYRVWLIQASGAGAGTVLTAVDSLTTSGSSYPQYNFSNVAAGSYLVKAALLSQAAGTAGVIPTYHDSSLYWNLAQAIAHPGMSITYADIWMQNGIVTAGPGFVAGNVSLGANKGASAGVPGLEVYLRDNAGLAVKHAVTDANGDFSFANIAAGIYSVYPEHMNYTTTPATSVTITNGAPGVTAVNFNQDNTQKSIKPRGTTGITTVRANNITLHIAPNPASGAITVSWSGQDAKGAHLIITGITGSTLLDKAVTGRDAETLDVSSLRPGIYFLHGTAGLQGKTQKLVIE